MAKRSTKKKVTKVTKTAKKAVKKASKKTVSKATKSAAPARKKKTAKPAASATSTKKKVAKKTKVKKTSRPSAKKVSIPKKAKTKGITTKTTARKKKASGFAETKKAAPSATSQDPIQFPQDKPLPKTHLTAKELREFKELLRAKRQELVGDVMRLSNEALSNGARGQGEQSAMPIHMADVGSDNWEQEFTLGLLANEEALVREIDDALERIQNKTYGVCLATGAKISHARLRAKPWAQYCIEYARAREEGRAL